MNDENRNSFLHNQMYGITGSVQDLYSAALRDEHFASGQREHFARGQREQIEKQKYYADLMNDPKRAVAQQIPKPTPNPVLLLLGEDE